MRLLRCQRSSPVAQTLLADLRQAPQRGLRAFVSVLNVGETRPVENPGVANATAERIAVTADVLGQRIDDQRRVDRLWAEKVGRGHGVVDHVKESTPGAQLTDTRQVRDLRSWIGNGLDEDQPRFRPNACLDQGAVGCIDERYLVAVRRKRVEKAVGVAE